MSIFEKQKLKILATFSPLDFRGEAVFLPVFFYILGRFYIPVVVV
jgi:hypothetical protein